MTSCFCRSCSYRSLSLHARRRSIRIAIAPLPFRSSPACGAGAAGPSALRRAGVAHCSARMTRASGSGSSMTSPTCRPDRSMPSTWSASFRMIRTRMNRTVSKIRVAPIGGENTTQVNKDGTKIGLLGKSLVHHWDMCHRITQLLSGSIDGTQLSRCAGALVRCGTRGPARQPHILLFVVGRTPTSQSLRARHT